MVAFTTLAVGDVLYEGHKTRAAQSATRRMGWYPIRIVEVHDTHVMASWNGNPVRRYTPSQVKRWRRSMPKA